MVTKQELADALRDAIDEYQDLFLSEFETAQGKPEIKSKKIRKAVEIWNKYILTRK